MYSVHWLNGDKVSKELITSVFVGVGQKSRRVAALPVAVIGRRLLQHTIQEFVCSRAVVEVHLHLDFSL